MAEAATVSIQLCCSSLSPLIHPATSWAERPFHHISESCSYPVVSRLPSSSVRLLGEFKAGLTSKSPSRFWRILADTGKIMHPLNWCGYLLPSPDARNASNNAMEFRHSALANGNRV
ncbi:hypothetical protein PTI98_006155 [Pleurotus ostreatus]|nr:hypothetical protein PTI98_006155 [Pleurotus ostreatus]